MCRLFEYKYSKQNGRSGGVRAGVSGLLIARHLRGKAQSPSRIKTPHVLGSSGFRGSFLQDIPASNLTDLLLRLFIMLSFCWEEYDCFKFHSSATGCVRWRVISSRQPAWVQHDKPTQRCNIHSCPVDPSWNTYGAQRLD